MSSDEQSQRSLGVDRNIIVTNPSMDSATEDALPKDGDEKSATPPPGLLTTTSIFFLNATNFPIKPFVPHKIMKIKFKCHQNITDAQYLLVLEAHCLVMRQLLYHHTNEELSHHIFFIINN